VNQCGPVFYLVADPPGTEYTWSNSCGTITNETQANPHVACFTSPGICTLLVIVRIPLEEPDTCMVLVDVKPTSDGFVEEIICAGDSIEINGMYYREGNWVDTLYGESINGCDSILYIAVSTFDPVIVYVTYTGCTGDGYSIIVNDTRYNEANPTGTELLETINGCDSLILIDLLYLPMTSGSFVYEGCEGDGFEQQVNDVIYNESNPFGTEVLTGSNGCDSILTIICIFYPVTFGYELYSGCEGDGYSVVVDSILYDELNPNGTDTLINQNGCDSVVSIELIFEPPGQGIISYVGCMGDGYSIEVLGHIFDESNPSGTFVIIPPTGCDSLITIDLQYLDCNPSLILVGDQLCVSDTAQLYKWYTCDGTPLPDSTQCITVDDTGCVCVITTNGFDIDTVCRAYKVCLLESAIHGPDSICGIDSVLFYFTSSDSLITGGDWEIIIDTNTTLIYAGADSIWVNFDAPGCYEIKLQLEADECMSTSIDTVCVYPVPESYFCCTQPLCDTCVTLSVFLTGTPPWTVAISNGVTTDTIAGIENSVFEYVDCPPSAPVEYVLVMMKDATCEGIIYDSIATIFEQFPIDPFITFEDDTLCAPFESGFRYSWRKCADQNTLSTDICFVPESSGCYCVELTDMTYGCTYSDCIVIMLTDVDQLNPLSDFALWYNRDEHSIDFVYDAAGVRDLQVQLTDILGRIISYSGIESMGDERRRIQLVDQVPSMLFVTLYTDHLRATRGIFIPAD